MILLIDNYDSFTWTFVNWGRMCWLSATMR